jgi:rhamnogalacturonan endolyase
MSPKILLYLLLLTGCSALKNDGDDVPYERKELLYEDPFEESNTADWVAESEDSFNLADHIMQGALDIDVSKGITIWNTRKFTGDVLFEFKVTVVKGSGKNDRVSDLNCFWMATDPESPGDFFKRSWWRKGIFYRYYSLNLYYVGYGGHDNSKTRFRKYNAVGQPVPDILQEYTDAAHLITPNKENVIRISCLKNTVAYYFNDEKIFELNDVDPYREGYFGFRTTNNHMRVESFKVYRIQSSR